MAGSRAPPHNRGVSELPRAILRAAVLLASLPIFAQPPIVHAETDLVLVPAVVTDHDYHPLFDLHKDQFELRVDRAVTPVSEFWKETGPVSVVIVIDASKSMESVLERSKDALKGFLNLAQPDDEYALVLCKRHGSAALPFTSDLDAISESFLSVMPEGSTPLFDSLALALDLVKQAKHTRRAILVISDGLDTSSKTKFEQVRAKVLESTADLYILEFWTGHAYDLLERQPLHELADLTGGSFFDDVSPKRFAEYFADMDIHQRYVLAFHPAERAHDNRQHRLEVRLHGVTARNPKVFWRHVYTDSTESIQ